MGRHSANRVDTKQRSSPRDWMVSLVVAALVTSAVGTAAAAEEPEGTLASGNLVTNGTFDRGDDGWHGNSSTRLIDAEGEADGRALGLENITRAPRTVVLNDRSDTVAVTVAGHTYRASARVQVHRPEQSVVLRVREWDHSRAHYSRVQRPLMVGQRLNHDWVTTTGWRTIEVDYRARQDGSTLDLNVVAYNLGAGHRIDVDDVTVVDLTADAEVPVPEVTPPPAPVPTPTPVPIPIPTP